MLSLFCFCSYPLTLDWPSDNLCYGEMEGANKSDPLEADRHDGNSKKETPHDGIRLGEEKTFA